MMLHTEMSNRVWIHTEIESVPQTDTIHILLNTFTSRNTLSFKESLLKMPLTMR